MGILFDAVTTTNGGSNNQASFSHTIDSLSTLVVFFLLLGGTGGANVSVTFGGQNMTIAGGSRINPGSTRELRVAYLLNPPTGAQTGTWNWTTNRFWHAALASYKNVKSVGIENWNNGTGTSISVDVSTVSGDWVLHHVANNGADANDVWTLGANQTQRWSTGFSVSGTYKGGDEEATGSTTTISATTVDSNDNVLQTLIINPTRAGNQAVWFMSQIWDRLNENRKKIGLPLYDHFRERNGILQPQGRLVTI